MGYLKNIRGELLQYNGGAITIQWGSYYNIRGELLQYKGGAITI